ncbi:MAG: class I SAM-dependent rRNA methyltransferase [Planctomycetia bacterium]
MNGPTDEKLRDPALVDFGVDSAGAGRRLERLGGLLVDRPLPQADAGRRRPAAWPGAAAVYRPPAGDRGGWAFNAPLPDPWRVHVPVGPAALALEVRPAPSGQIGVFLEQVEQWRWLAGTTPRGGVMLSLFAHSGAASLAMAAAGAEVVHVDASKQAIALARRNAAASGLADLPIRWVCEDAAMFVARQTRRGQRFSGAVLDPPSWGHGPRGEAFAIDRDMVPLVHAVARLLSARGAPPPGPVLLTCHSPAWHHRRLRDTLDAAGVAAALPPGGLESGRLTCTDDSGRTLDLGDFARRSPSA